MAPTPEVDAENEEVRTERKLRRSGGSLIVAIPPALLDALDADEGDAVELAQAFDSSTVEVRDAGDE